MLTRTGPKFMALIITVGLIVTAGCGEIIDTETRYGSITLAWVKPTLNTDGTTAVGQIAGYRIYYGRQSGKYSKVITIDDPDTLILTIQNLLTTQWFFAATAYNIYGNESDYSDELSSLISPVSVPETASQTNPLFFASLIE
ncbi:MAG: fibronectin type III domain-containing protein [bacterium]|nr:fibronectin type III domain-containing protein [bacterium]